MSIDVECPNPDCRCRMQFESLPPAGRITCPACGTKIPLPEPELDEGEEEVEEVVPVEEEEAAPVEDEYRQAEEMAEETVLGVEPVKAAAPVARAVPAEDARGPSQPSGADKAERRPIDHWVSEQSGRAPAAASAPTNGAESRVKRRREIPPILVMSAFSTSLLIVLIAVKWYVQTGGRWKAEEPPAPPPKIMEQPVPEGKATVDGWGSEDDIAKKLEEKVAEWEKSRPDPKFVTVSKKEGAANFTCIRDALLAVDNGGVVEIQDSGLYDEAMIGSWQSEDPEERRISRKRGVVLRAAQGQHPRLRWPPGRQSEGYNTYLLYIGGDWTISNLVFEGDPKKTTTAISAYWGGVDVRGCGFTHLRYGVMRGSKHEETEIRDCVFENTTTICLICDTAEIPNVILHNNVVKGASGVIRAYRPKDTPGVADLLAFSVCNNIFMDSGELLSGYAMPKQVDVRCDYNCIWQPMKTAVDPSQQQMANVLGEHLAKLQKAKKCDANSIDADPLLNKVYRLSDDSPCRGKGKGGSDMGVDWDRVATVAKKSPPGAKPGKADETGKVDHSRVYTIDR